MNFKSLHQREFPTYQIWIRALHYRASTGPEQGFPCVVFPRLGKTCFHCRVPSWWKQVFPCWKYYTGKTLFSLQGWVCSEAMTQIVDIGRHLGLRIGKKPSLGMLSLRSLTLEFCETNSLYCSLNAPLATLQICEKTTPPPNF